MASSSGLCPEVTINDVALLDLFGNIRRKLTFFRVSLMMKSSLLRLCCSQANIVTTWTLLL